MGILKSTLIVYSIAPTARHRREVRILAYFRDKPSNVMLPIPPYMTARYTDSLDMDPYSALKADAPNGVGHTDEEFR